jgi:hypothetical protein
LGLPGTYILGSYYCGFLDANALRNPAQACKNNTLGRATNSLRARKPLNRRLCVCLSDAICRTKPGLFLTRFTQLCVSFLVYSRMRNHWISRTCGTLAWMIIAGNMLCLPPRSAAEEVIVRVAPPPPRVETVPPPPSRYYIWDPGHWRWDGRAYVWVPGHYVQNPHHYARWIPGHWVNRGGGWYWVEGHWRH